MMCCLGQGLIMMNLRFSGVCVLLKLEQVTSLRPEVENVYFWDTPMERKVGGYMIYIPKSFLIVGMYNFLKTFFRSETQEKQRGTDIKATLSKIFLMMNFWVMVN